MATTKIQSTHQERIAFVYVRQSTPWQVMENRESTERQYRLRDRAIELGWPPSQVEVIDEDQGRSGSSAAHRTGFQRLATEVSLGRVRIVLMLEASRLARNNSDWYRLMEICGVSGTLIADEGGVYNPREPNDRLLLGVKGTISEAELFTLRTRLYQGRWNKARKGLLRFPLPVGYVQGADGGWILDPDTQVRERLNYLFDGFRRHGVVRAVVRELKQQGLELPTRVTAQEGYGSLVWKAPTLSAVIRILHNPAYAGAYVYGRSEYSNERRSPKTGKASAYLRSVEQWPVRITAHHPAYIRWEEFVKNQERLRQNWSHDGNRGVPREGSALLQGIVYCSRVRAEDERSKSGGEREPIALVCLRRGYQDGDEKSCQTMTSRPVDAAVVAAFLGAVSPISLRVATQVLDQVEQDLIAQRRQRELQLEQAVPVGIVARQTGNLQNEHNAHVSERYFAGQTSEAGTLVGAGAGEPEVFIDDHHLLWGPAQLTGALGQGVLAGRGLAVLLDLGGRGLAKVNEGRALEVRGFDFGQISHWLPPGVGRVGRLGSSGAREFR